jgi:hypothetical protein
MSTVWLAGKEYKADLYSNFGIWYGCLIEEHKTTMEITVEENDELRRL